MRTPAPSASLLLVAAALASVPSVAAEAPPTVYEAAQTTPENMDYDAANKTFRAHSGWLNDRLIHYYKFRMYTPMTYPGNVSMDGNVTIPIAPLYLASTDGTLAGIDTSRPPIVRYAHTDGERASDFVEVVLYRPPANATEASYRSWEDLRAAGLDLNETGAYVNAPLVPVGSKLEAPGGGVAPIRGVEALYKNETVQLFLFETTHGEVARAYNNATREGNASAEGSGFEMVVTPFVRNGNVSILPIWHLNQYGARTEGEGGGPAATGQRNIIASDRRDTGYSPLWQVLWISQLPPGYSASQASHPDQITEANGFRTLRTPMFVNCPNVGPHGGGETNARKASAFSPRADLLANETVALEGALVMEPGVNLTAWAGERPVGGASTNMMGAYRIHVQAANVTPGTSEIVIEREDGTPVASFALAGGAGPSPTPFTPSPPTRDRTTTPTPAESADAPAPALALLVGCVLLAATLARRR